jgi:hypothetical protein
MCEPLLSRKCVSLYVSKPSSPPWAVTGIALPIFHANTWPVSRRSAFNVSSDIPSIISRCTCEILAVSQKYKRPFFLKKMTVYTITFSDKISVIFSVTQLLSFRSITSNDLQYTKIYLYSFISHMSGHSWSPENKNRWYDNVLLGQDHSTPQSMVIDEYGVMVLWSLSWVNMVYTLFTHQCNPSLNIKKFHSSTSQHVSAATKNHQVSCYAKTVALYKIYKVSHMVWINKYFIYFIFYTVREF